MREVHASWCKSVQRGQTVAECNCARTATTDPTPPAQAMTAEMEAARKVWWNALSRRGNPQSLTSNYRSFAAGYEAARQSWEAERAVLVTEAASAAVKLREKHIEHEWRMIFEEDNWQLRSVLRGEPTEDMITAGEQAIDEFYNGGKSDDIRGAVRAVYVAMCKARGDLSAGAIHTALSRADGGSMKMAKCFCELADTEDLSDLDDCAKVADFFEAQSLALAQQKAERAALLRRIDELTVAASRIDKAIASVHGLGDQLTLEDAGLTINATWIDLRNVLKKVPK